MDAKSAERTVATTSDGISLEQAQALRRLVDDMVMPGKRGFDPIVPVLKAIADQVAEAGITEADIEAELAAYNLERRS